MRTSNNEEVRMIENTLSEYNNMNARLDGTIEAVIKKVGRLDFTDEIRDDYINSYIVEVPAIMGDFPLATIEYKDNELPRVYIKYYIGRITDKEAFCKADSYIEDALSNYKDIDFKVAILEKIKDSLTKKSN